MVDVLFDLPDVMTVVAIGGGVFEAVYTDQAEAEDFDIMRKYVGNRPLRLMERYPDSPSGLPQWRIIFGG